MQNRIFCSPSCYTAHAAKHAKTIGYRKLYQSKCHHCGKAFNPHRRSSKFCSINCAAIGRSGDKRRKFESVQCHNCGKTVSRKKSTLGKTTRTFCSRECKGLFDSKFSTGNRNPNFKNSNTRKCIGCGSQYKSYNKERKFCGIECSQKFQKSSRLDCSRRGLVAEKMCASELVKRGYHCTLSSGSRGDYDVIAINDCEILLIQVKRTGSKSRANQTKAINKLKAAKAPKCNQVKKQIWCYVDGSGWKIKTL